MRLILLGLPGAGKGTQAKLLQARFGVPHISTGDMFREAIRSGSEIGRKAKGYIDRGELVPDDVAIEIVKNRLERGDCAEGYLLDGFPRTVAQAKALDAVLAAMAQPVEAVLDIQISEDEAIRRIENRRVCRQCGSIYPGVPEGADGDAPRCQRCGGELIQRPDDNEETARNRLKVYLRQTYPLVDYYRERDLLIEVDGEQAIEDVYKASVEALKNIGVVPRSSGVWG